MKQPESMVFDPQLGYMQAIPLPYYCWQLWKWQKVRCICGKTFVVRGLDFVPSEYATHYALNHVDPL